MGMPTDPRLDERRPLARWTVARRYELGMTQRELADRLGVTPSWVGVFERKRKPTAYQIARVCRVLGLDVHKGIELAGRPPVSDEDLEREMQANLQIASIARATRKAKVKEIEL